MKLKRTSLGYIPAGFRMKKKESRKTKINLILSASMSDAKNSFLVKIQEPESVK